MRDRANSFRNLATTSSFDDSPPLFSARPPPLPTEVDFVKNLRPKLSEIPRWQPSRSRIRIDLSAIREAFESEVEDMDGILGFGGDRKGKRLSCKEFWGEWNGDEHRHKDWEPIRALKTRFKEFEKNSEFVGKLKSSFVCSFSC